MNYEIDGGTTVKRMESDMLNLMREKFQRYSESIFHFLNIELVVKGDSSVVDFMIPNTTMKLTFNPDNEGYGLKIFNGRDFAFVSPSEISMEDSKPVSLEEGMMQLSENQIRTILELLKNAEEGLQEFVKKRKEELLEKLNLIGKY